MIAGSKPQKMEKRARATQRPSYVYYLDWAEETLEFPDELRLKIDDAVKRYVLYGEEPTDREVVYSIFGLMRKQIDRDAERYNDKCEKNRQNQIKRWARLNALNDSSNNTNEYDRIQTNTDDTDTDTDTDTGVCEHIYTHTREGNFSPEEEKRLSSFDKLLEEKALTFAKSVPPISLEQLDELKAHASAQDIIEVMEEIENKVAAKGKCPYSNAATTIKIFLQTKGVWKTKEI